MVILWRLSKTEFLYFKIKNFGSYKNAQTLQCFGAKKPRFLQPKFLEPKENLNFWRLKKISQKPSVFAN